MTCGISRGCVHLCNSRKAASKSPAAASSGAKWQVCTHRCLGGGPAVGTTYMEAAAAAAVGVLSAGSSRSCTRQPDVSVLIPASRPCLQLASRRLSDTAGCASAPGAFIGRR